MTGSLEVVCATAVVVAFVHTLVGPDHYLPFIMLGRANKWGSTKLALVTIVCGVAHVMSSVVLGLIGIAAGVALRHMNLVESVRGEIAGYGLIAFGLVYMVWGIRQARKGKPHEHVHFHVDGEPHDHTHSHHGSHAHIHGATSPNVIWWLVIAFGLGPCEPLIPLLMYPAAMASWSGIALVSAIFGVVTIATMTVIAQVGQRGLMLVGSKWTERNAHALAGGAIAATGLAVRLLGL